MAALRAPAALLVALLAPATATAAPVADAVARAARAHVLEQAERAGLHAATVTLKVVDAERALPACATPPQIDAADTRFLTRMRFAASCGNAWREEFVVRAELSAEVVIASTRIAANRPIAPGDVEVARRALNAAEAAASDPEAVIGLASRRALRAGQVVDPRTLNQPVLVQRGAAVSIVARNGPVQVSTRGEALAAGREGDLIEVRNTASGKVIRARVTDSNEVEPADLPPSVPPNQPIAR